MIEFGKLKRQADMTGAGELQGWGEIAAHLGVSRKTAQTYEREHGLPVRRMPGPKGRVWALAAELDGWKRCPSEISETASVRAPGRVVDDNGDARDARA